MVLPTVRSLRARTRTDPTPTYEVATEPEVKRVTTEGYQLSAVGHAGHSGVSCRRPLAVHGTDEAKFRANFKGELTLDNGYWSRDYFR